MPKSQARYRAFMRFRPAHSGSEPTCCRSACELPSDRAKAILAMARAIRPFPSSNGWVVTNHGWAMAERVTGSVPPRLSNQSRNAAISPGNRSASGASECIRLRPYGPETQTASSPWYEVHADRVIGSHSADQSHRQERCAILLQRFENAQRIVGRTGHASAAGGKSVRIEGAGWRQAQSLDLFPKRHDFGICHPTLAGRFVDVRNGQTSGISDLESGVIDVDQCPKVGGTIQHDDVIASAIS